ncbi:MAG: hypothetical protein LBU02_02910 [Rickettsiales bacterium]|jgi:hypothetical protein|nr:hypothetical protein [Rickettsiales bacterium]
MYRFLESDLPELRYRSSESRVVKNSLREVLFYIHKIQPMCRVIKNITEEYRKEVEFTTQELFKQQSCVREESMGFMNEKDIDGKRKENNISKIDGSQQKSKLSKTASGTDGKHESNLSDVTVSNQPKKESSQAAHR